MHLREAAAAGAVDLLLCLGGNLYGANPESRQAQAALGRIETIVYLAHRLHGSEPINWRRLQDPVYVRELIARTVTGYAAIAEIDASKREFEVAGPSWC